MAKIAKIEFLVAGLRLMWGYDATCNASRSLVRSLLTLIRSLLTLIRSQESIFSLLSQRESGGNESYSNNKESHSNNNSPLHSSPRPKLPPKVPLAP